MCLLLLYKWVCHRQNLWFVGVLAECAFNVFAQFTRLKQWNEIQCEKPANVFVIVTAAVATVWAVELPSVFGRRHAAGSEDNKEDHDSTFHMNTDMFQVSFGIDSVIPNTLESLRYRTVLFLFLGRDNGEGRIHLICVEREQPK